MYNGLIQLALTLGNGNVAELSEKNYQDEYDAECILNQIGEENLIINMKKKL